MALLHIGPGIASHRVKIGQLCFALTSASMVTACGVAGKVICRTGELQAGSPAQREPEPQPQWAASPARAGRCDAHLSLSLGLVLSCLSVEA